MLVIGWFGAVWEGRGGTGEGSPEHFLPLCPGRLGTKCRNGQSLMLSPSFSVPLLLVQRWAFALLPPKGPAGSLPLQLHSQSFWTLSPSKSKHSLPQRCYRAR